jgi:hypothetical protein
LALLYRPLLAAAAALCWLGGPGAGAQPLPARHPLLGAWVLTLPDGDCQETYYLFRDGTSLVISGEEVTQSQFTLSEQPSERGYYRWDDKVVLSNGRPDCQGGATPVGSQTVQYILLHPDGDRFLLCAAEDRDTCVGPLERQDGTAA